MNNSADEKINGMCSFVSVSQPLVPPDAMEGHLMPPGCLLETTE